MKSVEEIYREMLDCFAQRTGMRPAEGCDLAARLYAVAAQVYALYAQADWVLRQPCIWQQPAWEPSVSWMRMKWIFPTCKDRSSTAQQISEKQR